MIDLEILEKDIQKGSIKNKYIMVGLDELLIKEGIDSIVNLVLDSNFKELNLIKIDGLNTTFQSIMEACETLPFMSSKKVVVVYRANFLKDKTDSASKSLYNEMKKYLNNTPEHCILIMYYLLNDKRDRAEKNAKLKTLGKSCEIVKADKLKGEKLLRKVKSIFDEKNKDIGRTELKYFCDIVENNFNVIEREVEKLVCYVGDRKITRDDIMALTPKKEDEDIFDLVEFLSMKKPEKAIDLMNELILKGESVTKILALVENQINMLFKIKTKMDERKSKETIAKEIGRPPFVAEKLMGQSRKFSYKSLEYAMKACVKTDKILKSTGGDKKMEMELLFINITIR